MFPSSQPSISSPVSSASSSSPSHTPDSATASKGRRTRVSAEHTLNRVRENQRRHRARQRDHVASLEQKLAETEALLASARAEIAILKEQAQQHSSTCINQQEANHCVVDEQAKHGVGAGAGAGVERYLIEEDGQPSSHMSLDVTSLSTLPLSPSDRQPTSSTTTSSSSSSSSYDLTFFTDPSPSPSPFYLLPSSPTPPGPPPCCSDPPPTTTFLLPSSLSSSTSTSTSTPFLSTDPECSSCKTRPPPAPTESTTLCAQAYVMIRQQNFRNLDPDTIRMWLAQGLRRAQREGEGCRVENGALMRLLDFISGL